jgi:hypothetical protein
MPLTGVAAPPGRGAALLGTDPASGIGGGRPDAAAGWPPELRRASLRGGYDVILARCMGANYTIDPGRWNRHLLSTALVEVPTADRARDLLNARADIDGAGRRAFYRASAAVRVPAGSPTVGRPQSPVCATCRRRLISQSPAVTIVPSAIAAPRRPPSSSSPMSRLRSRSSSTMRGTSCSSSATRRAPERGPHAGRDRRRWMAGRRRIFPLQTATPDSLIPETRGALHALDPSRRGRVRFLPMSGSTPSSPSRARDTARRDRAWVQSSNRGSGSNVQFLRLHLQHTRPPWRSS